MPASLLLRTRLRQACGSVLLGLAAAACSSAPRVIPLAETSAAPSAAASIADYKDAFQAIAAVFGRDFGLPVPRVSLYLYPSRDAFEQGLIAERHMEPELARGSASFARGIGGPDKILVNEAALAKWTWPERTRFLAHEFTHTVQYDLARGRRSTSEQWLREGYAEWVSYRTVDALGLGRYADWKAQRLRQFTNARGHKTLPALGELSTFPQWVSWRTKQGSEVTYNQGFLAVDYLIERTSRQAAVEYFRLFARSDDRLANFSEAFGLELPAFEREFARYLEGLR